MQVWKAQIAIVGDKASYRSMTCLTCEQQQRVSTVHLLRRIRESIFIAACRMHDYDEDRKTEQCTQR